jgi:P2-related tail formation protein
MVEYKAALRRICTKLSLCGKVIADEEKIEKTLSTFHLSVIQSARNYRQDAYKQYSDLIDMMQVNEAQDDALKTNFNVYPNGKDISTKVNIASYKIRKPI